jgi:bifunctional non-homologous end joining protein LigD
MECLAVPKLPDGPGWVYEIKLDGYRALAFNSDRKLGLSRKRKGFHRQYVHIFDALSELPPNTVLDGEIVALDDAGRPNFNLLQCFRAKASRVCYFVFDLLVYQGRDLTQLALVDRREILKTKLQFQSALIRIAQCFAPKRPQPLVMQYCPFANLPEIHKDRWGTGRTADDT